MSLEGPQKPKQEKSPIAQTPEYWKENRPFKSPRAYYELEFSFARLMAERTGLSLVEAVDTYAPVVRNHIHTFDEAGDWHITGLEEGVTDENMLEHAWERSWERNEERNSESTPYHKEGGSRFGCHYYDTKEEEPGTVYIHFFNAEFEEEWVDGKDVSKGPLDKSKIERRLHELTDMFRDIRSRHPDAEQVRCQTWLNNIDPYLRLFPDSYQESAKGSEIDYDRELWGQGTTVWGQFLGGSAKEPGQYGFKEEMATAFLERAKEVAPERVADALEYPVRTAQAPIADFYKLYGID
jgi:hypothetical protein